MSFIETSKIPEIAPRSTSTRERSTSNIPTPKNTLNTTRASMSPLAAARMGLSGIIATNTSAALVVGILTAANPALLPCESAAADIPAPGWSTLTSTKPNNDATTDTLTV
jgi:hypothetical protein